MTPRKRFSLPFKIPSPRFSVFRTQPTPPDPHITSTQLRFRVSELVAPGVQPRRMPAAYNISSTVPLLDPSPLILASTESILLDDSGSVRRFGRLGRLSTESLDPSSIVDDSGWPRGARPPPVPPALPALPAGADYETDDEDEDSLEHGSDMQTETQPSPSASGPSSSLHPAPSTLLDERLHIAPTIEEAEHALKDIEGCFRERVGKRVQRWKEKPLNNFERMRLTAMRSMLAFYTNKDSRTYGHWAASSLQAAISQSRGRYCARILRNMVRVYIANRNILAVNPYGAWITSMLCDEDLRQDIQDYLVTLGRDITAEKLAAFLHRPEVLEKHDIDRPVSVRTCVRWLRFLGYRYKFEGKGQFSDGHERQDVVLYRDTVYIPAMQSV